MGWSDIPLCKEQGIPVDEYKMPRDIFLPPGVPEAAVAYYAQVMKKVSETPEWAEYIARTRRPRATWRAPSSRRSSGPTRNAAA